MNGLYDAVSTVDGRMLLCLMCSRALEMLESLTLCCTRFMYAEAFFEGLKRTCALLRAIDFRDMALSETEMGLLRVSLERRDEKRLPRLRGLKLGGDHHVTADVGHLLRSRACSELEVLQVAVDENTIADLATYMMRTRGAKLQELDVSGGIHRPRLDALVKSLARPTARLRALRLGLGVLEPQSLLMLADAIHKGAWEMLETITMFDVDADLDGLNAVMEAMRGSCPQLREMEISRPLECDDEEELDRSGKLGRAIALALAPNGLVALKKLSLPEILLAEDADEVAEALARRDTGTSLEALELTWGELSSPESLVRAIKSPSCQDLRSLNLGSCQIINGDILQHLSDALDGGACRQLEELVLIKMDLGNSLSALSSALLRGACPKLRRLELGGSAFHDVYCSKASSMSIVPILAGRAPCSRHLKKLRLDSCDLNAGDMKLMTAAIASPQGIRLTELELYYIPIGDEGFMELIKALQGGAGSNLQRLTVSDCGVSERRWDIVAALLEAGNFPALTEAPPLLEHARLKAAIDARKRGL